MAWEKASKLAKSNKLGVDQARAVIAAGVADVLAVSGQTLPTSSIKGWCERWLEIKEVESESSTHSRYELAIRAFLDFLGPNADRDLSHLTSNQVLEFRSWSSKKLSVGSTNTNLRVVRACLNTAVRHGLMEKNVASLVSSLKASGENKRRDLTPEEIRRVLTTCGDTPWRGLVLVGLYTGQRLADCARLSWQQIDINKKTIWFVTQKTGKRVSMILAKPLVKYLESMPSSDNPSDYVFPRFAETAEKNISSLSNAFAVEVLIPAGLMQPRPLNKKSTGVGRTGKRQVNEVTFHSLRHSFVTMLKSTGASNAMAEMIVGHESPAISRHYTHLAEDDTTDAISKLPDYTS